VKNLYLDRLAVGGGDAAGMLRRIKKAAGRVRPGAEPKFLQDRFTTAGCRGHHDHGVDREEIARSIVADTFA
jgi:hypothetical protein